MERIWIYDTTLRDGAQAEGVSFTVADKLEVVRLLDELGTDYIEGGWPGSNAKDLEFFYQLRSVPLKHSRVVAFTSTRRKGQRIEEDEHMNRVLGTGLRHCAVVGKTWDFHVEAALRTDLKENLSMIKDTIAFLKERDIEALFDAEHFFDAYKHNPDYALSALAAARDAGADWFVLCDTNGGMLPHEISEIVAQVKKNNFGPLSIHAHNDGGLAVANALAAVREGATQVQVTINGFGERCGNTDLCIVVPNLTQKLGMTCQMGELGLTRMKELSERLYQMTGKEPTHAQPFVGRSAFAHKAGIHVSAVVRNPSLYEHVNPEIVGNDRRVLISELSGASNVIYQLERHGLPTPQEAVTRILLRVKDAEQRGYVYEEAESSLEMLMRDELGFVHGAWQKVYAMVENGMEGVTVSISWTQDSTTMQGRATAPTETIAVCEAVGLFAKGYVLSEDSIVPLSTVGDIKRYRARLSGACGSLKMSTVGVGTTRLNALVEAALQTLQYIHMKMEPPFDSIQVSS